VWKSPLKMRLRALVSPFERLSNANIRLSDAAMGKFAKADGQHNRPICERRTGAAIGQFAKGQRQQVAMIWRKDQRINGLSAGKRGATRRAGRPCKDNVRIA
jgi:hypothetical protein